MKMKLAWKGFDKVIQHRLEAKVIQQAACRSYSEYHNGFYNNLFKHVVFISKPA